MSTELNKLPIDRFNHLAECLVAEKLFKTFSDKQKTGIQMLMDRHESGEYGNNVHHVAYILATVYHETYDWTIPLRMMYPVKEKGGEAYLKAKPYYPFYGRDFCHTTWKSMYEKVFKFSGVDVVANPDLIAEPTLASKVIFHFMHDGLYTGKKLADYDQADGGYDAINARRIINGTDKAPLIAGYYRQFLNALNKYYAALAANPGANSHNTGES